MALSADPDRPAWLLAEVSILAVLSAARGATYPDADRIDAGVPELPLARAGVRGELAAFHLDGLARADFSQALRTDRAAFRDRPAAAVSALVDDAAVRWRPAGAIGFSLGRETPPFSRFRQVERAAQIGSAPPFVIDRVAPEARWGASAQGRRGSYAYAAGVYADGSGLELRDPAADPSRGGRAVIAARVSHSVRGPIGEPARPLPRQNPGHDQLRLELGGGALVRARDGERGHRVDGAASAHAAYRRVSATVEILAHGERGLRALAAAGDIGVLAGARGAIELRADVDPERGLWSAGAGATYWATANRRNAIALYGFARRPIGGGGARDALVLELRASL